MKIILRIPNANVNKIFIFPDSPSWAKRRYKRSGIAPILRSSLLGSLDLVKILRDSGTILQNTSNKRGEDNIFYQLLTTCQVNSDNVVYIAEELLLAGFNITIEDVIAIFNPYHPVEFVSERFQSPHERNFRDFLKFRVAFLLTSRLVQEEHSQMLTGQVGVLPGKPQPMLVILADKLQNEHASTIFERLFRVCGEEHHGACIRNRKFLDWALTAAARNGKLQWPSYSIGFNVSR